MVIVCLAKTRGVFITSVGIELSWTYLLGALEITAADDDWKLFVLLNLSQC